MTKEERKEYNRQYREANKERYRNSTSSGGMRTPNIAESRRGRGERRTKRRFVSNQ